MNAETYADVAESSGWMAALRLAPEAARIRARRHHYLGIPSRAHQPVTDQAAAIVQEHRLRRGAVRAPRHGLRSADRHGRRSVQGQGKLIGRTSGARDRSRLPSKFDCPLDCAFAADAVGERIMVDGNPACALGFIWGGATVCAWYPITPSTSVAEAFEKHAGAPPRSQSGTNNSRSCRPRTSCRVGMVIGAGWNGPFVHGDLGACPDAGILGLASSPRSLPCRRRPAHGTFTGMPTRTQQSDLLSAAYASHGDTNT